MAIIHYHLDHVRDNGRGLAILEACGIIQPTGLIRLVGAAWTKHEFRELDVFTNDTDQIPVKLTIYKDLELGGSWAKIESAKETKMVTRLDTLEVGADSNGFTISAVNFFAGRTMITYRGKTLQDVTFCENPRKMRQFCSMAKRDGLRHERNLNSK